MNSYISLLLEHVTAMTAFGLFSYLLGHRLLHRMAFHSAFESVSFRITFGLGMISATMFLLAAFGVLYKPVVVFVFLSFLLLCYRSVLATLRAVVACVQKARLPHLFVALLIALVFAPSFVQALYPPSGGDDIAYHLVVAKEYLREHALVPTPQLRFAVFPNNIELLFTVMLMFFTDLDAALIQWLMGITLVAMIYALGRRYCSMGMGLLAAALFFSSPLVVRSATLANVDIGVTLFLTAAVYSFANYVSERRFGWILLSGAFFGFALGAKYNAAIVFAFSIVAFLFLYGERRWAYLATWMGLATLLAAPWYIRNLYYTGNPIYPFLQNFFGVNQMWTAQDVRELNGDIVIHLSGKGRGVLDLILLPWNLIFEYKAFDPQIPLSWLYLPGLPLSLAAWKKVLNCAPVRIALLLLVAYTAIWFLGPQVTRYLIPVLPLLSFLCALGVWELIARSKYMERLRPYIITALMALCLYQAMDYSVGFIREAGLPPATAREREEFLDARFRAYSLLKLLNELAGQSYTLYALGERIMAYYAQGHFVGERFGPTAYRYLLKHFGYAPTGKAGDGEALYNALKAFNADYFLNAYGDPYLLPEDQFFKSHFELIEQKENLMLFRLAPRE